MINLIELKEGEIVELDSGATAIIVENVGDGQWVNARYLTHPDPNTVGLEELIHSQEIRGVAES